MAVAVVAWLSTPGLPQWEECDDVGCSLLSNPLGVNPLARYQPFTPLLHLHLSVAYSDTLICCICYILLVWNIISLLSLLPLKVLLSNCRSVFPLQTAGELFMGSAVQTGTPHLPSHAYIAAPHPMSLLLKSSAVLQALFLSTLSL